MPKGFHPRRQGDVGEAAAIEWLTRLGAAVSFPLFHSPDYDLIADLGGRLLRVQVKTSSCKHGPTDHFAVQLATSGGNQSWNGVVKEFDAGRIDFLFVLVEDGRRWFIPTSEIEGRHGISLGGDKYSEFQIGRSEPLDQGGGSTLDALRGGAGVGEPGRTVNPVAQPEWVRFPPPPPPPRSSGNPSSRADERASVGRTKMSSHYQVAVPRAVAAAASLSPGDRFRVESDGTGRFVMTRLEEYLDQHMAQLSLPKEARDPAGAERRAPD
jgi:bifunctional DNA-binding transcriptional regulator/antitoxin component of YhaV-PrlF toxin-antitoxin module